jgi:hypothetical protein
VPDAVRTHHIASHSVLFEILYSAQLFNAFVTPPPLNLFKYSTTVRHIHLESMINHIHTLSYHYAMELEEGFMPYVKPTTEVLLPLMRYAYSENVRTSAICTIPTLLVRLPSLCIPFCPSIFHSFSPLLFLS